MSPWTWQSRYRAVRLLDDQAILACAAYVDLNPIRAALAETLEESDFTSIQRRIQALSKRPFEPTNQSVDAIAKMSDSVAVARDLPKAATTTVSDQQIADRFLSPLTIDERNDPIGCDAGNVDHLAEAASVGGD